MLIIKLILKFFKVLNSEADPWQIAAGFVIGLFLGLTPVLSLHNALLVIILLFVRINCTAALFSWGIFTLVSFATDATANDVGLYLLQMDSLKWLWQFVWETPVLAWFNLTNTLVLGSLVLAAVGAVPVFLLMWVFVRFYRGVLKKRVEKWKIIKVLKTSKLAKLYGATQRMK